METVFETQLQFCPNTSLALKLRTWKYNNTRNTVSFSVNKISFIFSMTPTDSTNDHNICLELFKATFTR